MLGGDTVKARAVTVTSFVAVVVPMAVAMAVAVRLSRPGGLSVNGDEPHYLVMADGIVHDSTLDLRNAYARENRSQRIYGVPLRPHVIIINHRWGPYHTPGLAFLLAIPFATAGILGAKLALSAIAGVLSLAVFVWLRRHMPETTAAWLTIGLTVALPISFGASQIYPDLTAGVFATALTLWLFDRTARRAGAALWAAFWLAAGLLSWLNVKFVVTSSLLTLGGMTVLWRARRRDDVNAAWATLPFAAVGPAALAAYYLWAFGTLTDPRTGELTTSLARATMMFLGLHLDQAQGLFFQQPLLFGGVAAFPRFARLRPRFALLWLALYASLIVPNAFQVARYGGGGPAGRFGWSAAWLWIVPLAVVAAEHHDRVARYLRGFVAVCLAYQVALAVRWLHDPGVLFPVLDERMWARNSLFPVPLRRFLPSFYFWDFSSYRTYPPNVIAYAGFVLLLVVGTVIGHHMRRSDGRPTASPARHRLTRSGESRG